MSDTIATYTFLPWLRTGVANKITAGDNDNTVKMRATVKVNLTIDGEPVSGTTALTEPVSKDVQLYGPGDIVGIDNKAIIKAEPHNWITNFEPNYVPYIEFYNEDFPWRYTPAAPDTSKDRLRPWIALVVLKEGDFEEAKNIKDKPLSYITVENAAAIFPPADELWAWAHVHVNQSLMNNIVANPSDKSAVESGIQSIITSNPDIASSRILCPIKLQENTAYHAFLVPTFETGRLAGLGINVSADTLPTEVFATLSAWAEYESKEEPANFPFYFRWHFRTGSVGDFEYLVRLLQPKPVDSRVGRKDIDVTKPGSNLRGITDPELNGILKLGGALQVPFDTLSPEDKANVTLYEEWDQPGYPHPFQKDLAEFINLANDYTVKSSADANNDTNLEPGIKNDCDPLITAPLYGRWHALTERLLKNRDGSDVTPNDNWIHELNLDPRWRVTAGYGTGVVQQNQEDYMSAAWKQVGDILEANRKMRLAHLAKITSASWYKKQVTPLVQSSTDKAMLFTAPVQKRVLANGVTVSHTVQMSRISRSVTSMNMRKVMRPGARVMKILTFNSVAQPTNLLTRINEEQVVIAPPKVIPAGLPTVDKIADDIRPGSIPPVIANLLRKAPWIKWILLALAILLLLLLVFAGFAAPLAALAGILGVAALVAFFLFWKWQKDLQVTDSIKEENQTPASVDQWPNSPDFVLSTPTDRFTPSIGDMDSVEATKYKTAVKEALLVMQTSKTEGRIEPKPRLDIPGMVNVTFTGINPEITIPKMILGRILIPDRIKNQLTEQFVEAMAYPEIDQPMYKPLVKVSTEMFLPNINYIGQNTISLLETNQRFIESYMVGLNHEFARELLWREYPTDQRGSYFRQFWDVSGFFNEEGLSEEELKEKLRDIPPLHRWSKSSKLGDHDHREEGGAKEEELVLVIRGELLKKYPNAVIYAQQAKWQLNEDGTINNKVERELVELTPAEKENPPRSKVKSPLYEAKVDPDIYFFGFDLTALKARGGTGEDPEDINNAGWFFCIKERPGEPRFGLDINQDTTPNVWNDLAWEDVLPGAPAGSFIRINNSTPTIALKPLGIEDNEKEEQRADDDHVSWSKDMNAADVAYIMYQVPVLVAVHAAEMLPRE